MNKKILKIMIAVVIVGVGIFYMWYSSKENAKKLAIWSPSAEAGAIVRDYFAKDHPEIPVRYTNVDPNMFPMKIDLAFMNSADLPDVIVLEDTFSGKYIGTEFLMDITDIYAAVKDSIVDSSCNFSFRGDVCYALPYQVCPGAMFYRRSLAKKYLGTDNPEQVQQLFADIPAFLASAAVLKEKSGGSCAVTASYADLFKVFAAMRENPWFRDESELLIDPAMYAYMDTAKTLHDNSYDSGYLPGTDEWFAGMDGVITAEDGSNIEVFSYFMPEWGYRSWLKSLAVNTVGDWAMIPGPCPFRWGGTLLAINKLARHPEAARQFIAYAVSDEQFLTQWVHDTGMIAANTNITDAVAGDFKDPILGGQSYYEEFAKIAALIDGNKDMGAHPQVDPVWNEAVGYYVNGEKSRQEAVAFFTDRMIEDFATDEQ